MKFIAEVTAVADGRPIIRRHEVEADGFDAANAQAMGAFRAACSELDVEVIENVVIDLKANTGRG